jgi:transcriptional regulator with XRE-family HTH domain
MELQTQLRGVIRTGIQRGKLSVSLLSRRTGISAAHLSNLINGNRNFSIESLERVLGAIGFAVEIYPKGK